MEIVAGWEIFAMHGRLSTMVLCWTVTLSIPSPTVHWISFLVIIKAVIVLSKISVRPGIGVWEYILVVRAVEDGSCLFIVFYPIKVKIAVFGLIEFFFGAEKRSRNNDPS